jgi:hypothetical protein
MQTLDSASVDARRWPTYRPRRAVVAHRLSEPIWLDGRYYRDGYIVRDAGGHFVVVTTAEFEAVYELSAE